MGGYRKLTEKLIQYGNSYAKASGRPVTPDGTDSVTATEMQVFEHILENEEKKTKMALIAQRIGISTSRLTKVANKLAAMGYLEKCHKIGNRKEVYVFVTEKGLQMYKEYTRKMLEYPYGPFFKALSDIPGENIESFIRALDILIESADGECDSDNKEEFIPIKKQR